MEDSKAQTFWFRVASAIGSLLAAAFLAWAGVVWSGWQDIADNIFQMANDVAEMRIEVKHIGEEMLYHKSKPWHDEAGQRIIELQTHQSNGQK